MIMGAYSDKLNEFINYISGETGKKIHIQVTTEGLGLEGMQIIGYISEDGIHVKYHPSLTPPDIEQGIAHELGHGYVTIVNNYYNPKTVEGTPDLVHHKVRLVFSMVEDIVVNKYIEEHGFFPYGSLYLPMTEKEINSMNQGKDIYSVFKDQDLKDKFRVFRYIQAWGFINYFDLNYRASAVLNKYISKFKNAFPRLNKLALATKEILLANDIFTKDGYEKATKEVLKLWGLYQYMQFS